MINLQQFCDPDRTGLEQPWSEGAWTCATNGHIGVRVVRRPDVTHTDGPPFLEMMRAREGARDLQPVLAVKVPPYRPDNTPVRLAQNLYISAKYYNMIAGLPNACIDVGCMPDKGPIRFEFDGGDGMVMPLEWREYPTILDAVKANAYQQYPVP